jgi:hypothetical protein
MGEQWVILELVEDETLRCHSCYKRIQKGKAHLYINVDAEIEEIECDTCWKKNQKEKNK